MITVKKYLKITISILMIILLLVGCAKEVVNEKIDTVDVVEEKKEDLIFRITWKAYSGRGETLWSIVDSYNEINETDFNIKLVGGDEDLSAIDSLLTKGDEVDIFVLPYRYVQSLGYKNKLEDLTDDFEHDKKLFYEELWNLGVVNEKLHGVPWLGHSMGLIYNKDILDKAGINHDQINSLESLLLACEKVEENTDANGIGLVGANHNDVSWMINQFIYGFGGSLVSGDGSEVTINSEASKLAIDFYKNQLGKYAQPTWTSDTGVEIMEYFRNQEIAFEIQGLWGVTDIWKNGRNFETGIIPLESIGLFPEVGPMMLAVQPGISDDKQDAAVAFIEYLLTVEAQEMIMQGEYSPEHDAYYPFRLPVRKDIAESSIFNKYPEFTVFLSGFEHPSIDVPVPLWQNVKDSIYALNLNKVMNDELSIDEFLKLIQDEGNEILQN